MVTLEHCLREASIAEDIAGQISLNIHRDRMLAIARGWRARAEQIRCNASGGARVADRGALH